HPLADELFPTIDRRILYVTMFLHDIAKGRPEDHSIAGAKIARRLCPRFGFSPAETETVAWLIQYHLLMSSVAQGRDVSDPKTIADFAAVVQGMERLKLLLILTVADIRAVGPGVWNGWKGQLLRSLYYETERVVSGGHGTGHAHRVEAAKAELRDLLGDWTDADFETYAARHSRAYWLKVEPETMAKHARMIAELEKSGELFAGSATTDAFHATTEITVIARDTHALLSLIAGACAAGDANIDAAAAFTTKDGLAVDSVTVRRRSDDDAEELELAGRIISVIENGARGRIRVSERVARKKQTAMRGRLKAFTLETQVTVSNSWSDAFTVIEVSGLDRPGLLYDLTSEISRLNLNISSAHIATFGERAADSFYVTDLIGEKIMHRNRQANIRKQLTAAFEGESTSKPAPADSRKAPAKAAKPKPAGARAS
ncbi:MAG: HD domain-containing protein, partial [Rhodobiaceae bacterium]|nr:HD domain-containing protein [Rhodobiaceae bacterium]